MIYIQYIWVAWRMWAGTFIHGKEWVKVLVSIEGKERGNKLDEMLVILYVHIVPIKVGFE